MNIQTVFQGNLGVNNLYPLVDLDVNGTIKSSNILVTDSLDMSFNENIIFLDGSANKIGIGTIIPEACFDISLNNEKAMKIGNCMFVDTSNNIVDVSGYLKSTIILDKNNSSGATGSFLSTTSNGLEWVTDISSTSVLITDDQTNTTKYITFVDNVSGYQSIKCDSQILSYNPNSNTLNINGSIRFGTGGSARATLLYSSTQNRSYNFPNASPAGSTSDVVITEGTQTINGIKTFNESILCNRDIALGRQNRITIIYDSSNSRLVNIPDVGSNSVFVLEQGVQTLFNKILQNASFNNNVTYNNPANTTAIYNTIARQLDGSSISQLYTIPFGDGSGDEKYNHRYERGLYKLTYTDENAIDTNLINFNTNDGLSFQTGGANDRINIRLNGDIYLLSNFYTTQINPTVISTVSTLTTAQLKTRIIQVTASVNITLPSGSNMDFDFFNRTNLSFDYNIINTSAGNISVLANTGHTIVGNSTVNANTSASFRTRRTALNTWVNYRLS